MIVYDKKKYTHSINLPFRTINQDLLNSRVDSSNKVFRTTPFKNVRSKILSTTEKSKNSKFFNYDDFTRYFINSSDFDPSRSSKDSEGELSGVFSNLEEEGVEEAAKTFVANCHYSYMTGLHSGIGSIQSIKDSFSVLKSYTDDDTGSLVNIAEDRTTADTKPEEEVEELRLQLILNLRKLLQVSAKSNLDYISVIYNLKEEGITVLSQDNRKNIPLLFPERYIDNNDKAKGGAYRVSPSGAISSEVYDINARTTKWVYNAMSLIVSDNELYKLINSTLKLFYCLNVDTSDISDLQTISLTSISENAYLKKIPPLEDISPLKRTLRLNEVTTKLKSSRNDCTRAYDEDTLRDYMEKISYEMSNFKSKLNTLRSNQLVISRFIEDYVLPNCKKGEVLTVENGFYYINSKPLILNAKHLGPTISDKDLLILSDRGILFPISTYIPSRIRYITINSLKEGYDYDKV